MCSRKREEKDRLKRHNQLKKRRIHGELFTAEKKDTRGAAQDRRRRLWV